MVKVGDRLKVPHGVGTVVGFERFDAEGFSAPMADVDDGVNRIVLRLDPGHSWPCGDRNYAVFQSQLVNGEVSHV